VKIFRWSSRNIRLSHSPKSPMVGVNGVVVIVVSEVRVGVCRRSDLHIHSRIEELSRTGVTASLWAAR
jgi:hypothetical protein